MVTKWELTDHERDLCRHSGLSIHDAQIQKKRAYIKAGGVILNSDALEDMYEALKAQHNAIDLLFALLIDKDKTFFPSKSGQPWEAIIQGNKALAKAEGKQ